MTKNTISATDRESASAMDVVSGRIVGISEDYADPALAVIQVELPAVTKNGDTFRPSRSVTIPKKAAGRFAIGDPVTITNMLETRRG